VSGTGSSIGGLIGRYTGTERVTNCYWDIETSSQNTSAVGEGRTTAQMKQEAIYVGWDFNT